MPVITISRQLGSLGDEIGRDVAARLGLRLVDQDIIEDVAQRLGVSPATIVNLDERDANVVSELVRTMRRLYPATIGSQTSDPNAEVDDAAYLQVVRQVIWEVARAGDAVIIGRGAAFILGEHPDTLHALVVAPTDVRLERIMAAQGLDRGQAARRLRESDGNRARHLRHFYGANWLDVSYYDLVLNTGHFSELRATSLLCAAAAREDSAS